MSEKRKSLIKQAFMKMDRNGDGVLTVADLEGVYDPNEHEKFKKGEMKKEEVFAEFLKTFDSPNEPDGKVCERYGIYAPLPSYSSHFPIYFIPEGY